jgi:hypothetical protein
MADPEPVIEVEVVAIDGCTVPPGHTESNQSARGPARWMDWQQPIQTRIRTLNLRWWPLWLLLGIIALVLILTLGVVLAILVLLAKAVRGIFLALLAPLLPRSGNTSIR